MLRTLYAPERLTPQFATGLAIAVFVNLAIVALPLALSPQSRESVTLDIALFLLAGTTMCVLEFTAGAKTSEVLNGYGRYRQAALVGSLLLLFLQWSCLMEFRPGNTGLLFPVSGFIVAICGCTVRVAGIRNLKTGFCSELSGRRLITTGLHSIIRHPSETGLILACAGLSIILQAWWSAGLFLPVCYAAAMIRIAEEERWLREAFGNDYVEYCCTAGRWLPNRKGSAGPVNRIAAVATFLRLLRRAVRASAQAVR